MPSHYDMNVGMENPVAAFVSPIASQLPNWAKLDGLGVAAFLWFFLDQYGLSRNEKFVTAAGAGAVHMLLHSIACSQQESIWGSSM